MKVKFDEVEDKLIYNFKEAKVVPSKSRRETAMAIQQRAFAVTGVYLQDKANAIKQVLDKSIEKGLSYPEFLEELSSFLKTKGFLPLSEEGRAFRWDVIYRTNIKTAFERGRFDAMQNLNDIFPYRRFVAVEDERTTTICRDLNGAVARYDSDLYLNNQCPRHFNCRSTWIIEKKPSEKEIKRWEGVKIKPAEGFGRYDFNAEFFKEWKETRVEKEKMDWLRRVDKLNEDNIEEFLKALGVEAVEKPPSYQADVRALKFYEQQRNIEKAVGEQNFWWRYTQGNYFLMNKYLRGDKEGIKPSIMRDIDRLVEAFNRDDWKTKTNSEMIVYRGERYSDVVSLGKRLSALQNGILTESFCSTSVDPTVAWRFAREGRYSIIFALKVKEGCYADVPAYEFPNEKEIVLNPVSKIKITSIKSMTKTIENKKSVRIYIEGEAWNGK